MRTQGLIAAVLLTRAPQQIARADTELPRTASPIPVAALGGLISLAGALGVRFLRRR
jgi:hypothetical protein